MMTARVIAGAALLMFISNAFAAECTLIEGPTTIDAPGCYRLGRDISITSPNTPGIVISADNVTLLLGGHSIIGPGVGVGSGIYAVKKAGITVRGGSVRGFLFGVHLDAAPSARVELVDASGNTFRGIRALGPGVSVERNRVANIYGSMEPGYEDAHSFGIEVAGPNCQVRGNSVEDVYPIGPRGEGVGISVSEASAGCLVDDNVIRHNRLPSQGRTLSLWVGGEPIKSVSRNLMVGAMYGPFRFLALVNAEENTVRNYCRTWFAQADYFENNDVQQIEGRCDDYELSDAALYAQLVQWHQEWLASRNTGPPRN